MDRADRRRILWIALIPAGSVVMAILSEWFDSAFPATWPYLVSHGSWTLRVLQVIGGALFLAYMAPYFATFFVLVHLPVTRELIESCLRIKWARHTLVFSGIVYSWIFWNSFFIRFLRFIDFWDPFSCPPQIRPWSYRFFIYFRDWWEIIRRFGRGPTGAWASLIEVLCWPFRDGDIFLGRPILPYHLGALLRPIGIPTEKHMVTLGGTGSGKSTAALIPNLCLHEGSLLCVDPKGELARTTARRRGLGGYGVRGMGQAVHVLDPFRIARVSDSASYNVFEEMEQIARRDVERPVSYAGKIAEALVKDSDRSTPYWDNAAKTLLRGLVLYVFQGPPEKRNLVHLRKLIMQGEAGDGDAFDNLLRKMMNCQPGPYRDAIAGAASALLIMGPNQFGSVVSTAQEHTGFLDIPEIQRISAKSDFLLDDLKQYKTSVYLCLPVNLVTGQEGRWLRMFVLLFIDMMMRNQTAPKPPILLAIDEFPSLGKLEGIEVIGPMMRSYGVRFWVVGQDIEQFQKVYPESWEGFIGNAEAVQFLGITHAKTVNYLAERLGRHVVMEQDRFGNMSRKMPVQYQLLDSHQVMRMLDKDRKTQIVWRGSKRPMLLRLAPYYEYLPSWYYDCCYPRKWRHSFGRWAWQKFGRDSVPLASANRPFPSQARSGPVSDAEKTTRTVLKFSELPSRQTVPTLPETTSANADATMTNSRGMDELQSLVGLKVVKDQIERMLGSVELSQRRKAAGLPALAFTNHLVFTGNPGTGKTTVARIVGKIYRDMGLLRRGHLVECGRSDLVGQYVGHTAAKTKAVVEKALGGVLFIDEAYSLAPRYAEDFGAEAIAQLITMMENARDDLTVIAAGYRDEMEKFIGANPGLKSRFMTIIDFPDYAPEEMRRIFLKLAKDFRCRLSADAIVQLDRIMSTMKRVRGFGNGREARNLFEMAVQNQALRLRKTCKWGVQDLTMIEAEDLPNCDGTRRYTAMQLMELFVATTQEYGYEIADDAWPKLRSIMEAICATRGYGVAGEAQALFEACLARRGTREGGTKLIEAADLGEAALAGVTPKRGRGRPRKNPV